MKKCAILFSGGKDSTYSAYLAKQKGYELTCLITLISENKESYMFHTPSIEKTKKQAEVMDIPIMISTTKGEKEKELVDLQKAIQKAKDKFGIDTLVTGALHSVYQASRIQKICDDIGIKCFNPLWHKNEITYLNEILENKFEILIIGVFAYPLDKSWLGRKVDKRFINKVAELKQKYNIHPAGEGGEFETFVLNCPLFKKPLQVKSFKDVSTGENSWRRDIEVE